VFFKFEYTIVQLTLREADQFRIDYDGPHKIAVTLRGPEKKELEIGHELSNALCTASGCWEVNSQNRAVFDKILSGEGKKDDSTKTALQYPNSHGRTVTVGPLSEFPQHFQSFIHAVSDELHDVAARTVRTLRWRTNVEYGSHNPFSSRGLHWSDDDHFWHPAPLDLRMRVQALTPPQVSKSVLEEITNVVKAGGSEPIHHNLFREAWEQRYTNPRSAIVIGVGAAEVAIKSCIGTIIPDAEWLAMNVPTPPVIKILAEYLPKLKARNTINGEVKPPPPLIMEQLKKAITVRNTITHAGAATPASDSIDQMLSAIRDLLWLLDFYMGHSWAVEFLSEEIRTELFPKRSC